MKSLPHLPPASNRERFAWAMYDFANSGYTTVVLTAIFSAYFVSVVAGSSDLSAGAATTLWTVAVATGNAIVLLSGPVVGAIADRRAAKKRFLAVTTVMCVLATALLSTAGPGDVGLAMTLVVVSFVMFASGENLISAFLPEIAPSGRMGRLSGYAWSLGYLGGLLTLSTCLGYITWAQARGLGAADFVPVTLWITAAIFALASAPVFLWLQERAVPSPLSNKQSYVRTAFAEVRRTLSEARHFKDLFRFLGCLVVFQAGVSTVFVVAAIYAEQEMGFTTDALVVLIMVVNVTAAVGAFAMGHIQDRFGSVAALALALVVWILGLALILLAEDRAGVWLAANLIGLAMGSCQASGRALIAHFTPIARTAEFFGLWGLAIHLAAIIGPLSYGLISFWSGGNQRLALLSTLGFFVLGLVLLTSVNEARGKRAALEANRQRAVRPTANGR